mmetsp:Transcript_70569/g.139855  ORF Transcript_70569/g.139855 Transcript_70569/m.139855 type:complete len:206 (-) Transcript_70569:151-768(-)
MCTLPRHAHRCAPHFAARCGRADTKGRVLIRSSWAGRSAARTRCPSSGLVTSMRVQHRVRQVGPCGHRSVRLSVRNTVPHGWFIISGVRLHCFLSSDGWPDQRGGAPGCCGYFDPYAGACCDGRECPLPVYDEIDGACDGGSGWEGGSDGVGCQLPCDIIPSPGAGEGLVGGRCSASSTIACDRSLSVARPIGSSSSSASSLFDQ